MAISRETLNGRSNEQEIIKDNLPLIVFLEDEVAKRVDYAGGKGASLAELRSIPGIKVPEAFVITTSINDKILQQNPRIADKIEMLDRHSLLWLKAKLKDDRKYRDGKDWMEFWRNQLINTGKEIEEEMGQVKLLPEEENEIRDAYGNLCQRLEGKNIRVAVRSSGANEDGNEFSFAGQHKTFLHQEGEEEVIKSTVECLASQFGTRAIEYRNEARLKLTQRSLEEDKNQSVNSALAAGKNFSHSEARLAVVVQEMADGQASGVCFSVDSKTGAKITKADFNYGLGESIVSGSVTPDSYDIDSRTGAIIGRNLGEKAVKTVYVKGGTQEIETSTEERKKFAVSDCIVKEVANLVGIIKDHYGKEMDTEFVIKNGEVHFTQARPETITSKENALVIKMKRMMIPEDVAEQAKVILKGGITGCPGVAAGIMGVAGNPEEAGQIIRQAGDKKIILFAERTDPDWVSVMKRVGGITTQVGGPNCHAAIVTRELEVPSIVGVGDISALLEEYKGKEVTIDAGERKIYEGALPLNEVGENINVTEFVQNPTETAIGLIISNPDMARKMHALAELGDNFKISLLRIEFLLSEIGVHVRALEDFDKGLLNSDLQQKVAEKTAGYENGKEYFITKLAEGIANFAAIFPKSDIIVRTTDFKTNEYANLIGGGDYEAEESNPMMGWRGLIRSLCPENREVFKWELEAIKRAREAGYKNIKIMFPVVRDPKELTGGSELDKIGFKGAFEIMKTIGMESGWDNLKVGIMVEVPTNAVRINDFIDTGINFISFGTNDLTQFTLATDRDNEKIGKIPWYVETNPAVVELVREVIRACKKRKVETGICGQAPSNSLAFVKMLIEEGINSVGVMPDKYKDTYKLVRAEEEKRTSKGKETRVTLYDSSLKAK